MVRAFELLRLLSAEDEAVPLSALASRAALPKSTARRLLATLESMHAVEQGVTPGTYVSGPGLAAIGGTAGSRRVVHAIAIPFLSDVVALTGEDATLAVLDQDSVVFTEQRGGPHPIQVPDGTGSRFPPHTVSSGFALMSGWSDARIERYVRDHGGGDLDPDLLRGKIDEARTRGYVWHIDGWVEGVSAVAAPVLDGGGDVVASLGAFGPTYRFPGDRHRDQLGRSMARIASQLSTHLP